MYMKETINQKREGKMIELTFDKLEALKEKGYIVMPISERVVEVSTPDLRYHYVARVI